MRPWREIAMAVAVPMLVLTCGVGLVAVAPRAGSHADLLVRLGGPLLVSGLVALGYELAHAGG